MRARRSRNRTLRSFITLCDTAPVFELAEQALNVIAPTVFFAIIRDQYAAVIFGLNDRLDIRLGEFLADVSCVIALIGKQRPDPVS